MVAGVGLPLEAPPQRKRRSDGRADGQVTALAGELFAAAELLKRGLQTSITFGNAKSIDLFAYNVTTKKTFTVQVKSLRTRNWFLISNGEIQLGHVYVFVILNKPERPVQYFVVPGRDLAADPARFGKYFGAPKMPGIHPKTLEVLGYEDAWGVFDE